MAGMMEILNALLGETAPPGFLGEGQEAALAGQTEVGAQRGEVQPTTSQEQKKLFENEEEEAKKLQKAAKGLRSLNDAGLLGKMLEERQRSTQGSQIMPAAEGENMFAPIPREEMRQMQQVDPVTMDMMLRDSLMSMGIVP